MKKKKILLSFFVIFVCMAVSIVWANYSIKRGAEPYITDDLRRVPFVKTGVLLGTGKYLQNGLINDFFEKRIKATVTLFKSGKIRFILISGDNSTKQYNEPQDMKHALVKQGIPEKFIYLDYAGFRTFDSMIRAKEIFNQDSFVVISQKFHNERAVYIARNNGVIAFGYNAEDVSAYNGFLTNMRELFARVKVFLDIFFGVKPTYLGEKIRIQ